MDIQSIIDELKKMKDSSYDGDDLDDYDNGYRAGISNCISKLKELSLQKQTKGRKTGFENYIDTPIHLQSKEQAIAGARKIVEQTKNEKEVEKLEFNKSPHFFEEGSNCDSNYVKGRNDCIDRYFN